jgi:hypothetical protein
VIDSDEDITVSSYELYELSNYSLLKNHVALVVVGKLVGEIFDVALTSLLPAVGQLQRGKSEGLCYAPSIGIARRSIGRSRPLGSSDRVAGHALGVTLTSLSPATECYC